MFTIITPVLLALLSLPVQTPVHGYALAAPEGAAGPDPIISITILGLDLNLLGGGGKQCKTGSATRPGNVYTHAVNSAGLKVSIALGIAVAANGNGIGLAVQAEASVGGVLVNQDVTGCGAPSQDGLTLKLFQLA